MDRKRQREVEDHFETAGWISGACRSCSPVLPNRGCPVCDGLGRVVLRAGFVGNLTYAQYVARHMEPSRTEADIADNASAKIRPFRI